MLISVKEFGSERQKSFTETLELAAANALFEETGFGASSPFKVNAVMTRVDKTFRVQVNISGDVQFECGRCLEQVSEPVDVDTEWVLMSRSEWVNRYEDGDEEVELNEEDLDISFYSGDDIDLSELIREAIMLELPTHPICQVDTKACDAAYQKNVGDKALKENEEAEVDLRWGPLKDIKLKN